MSELTINQAIGMMRQWLNEDRITNKKLVTNEELHVWLDKAIDSAITEARLQEARYFIDEVWGSDKPDEIYPKLVARLEKLKNNTTKQEDINGTN